MDEALLTLLKNAFAAPIYQLLLVIAFIYKCGGLKGDLKNIVKSIVTQFKSHFLETVSHIPPIFPRHKKTLAWGKIIILSFTAGYLLLIFSALGILTLLSANELPLFNVLALLSLSLSFCVMFFLQWGQAHKTAQEKQLF
ncbi:MAG: hypothetical protein WBA20_13385 [Ketobacter sp.]